MTPTPIAIKSGEYTYTNTKQFKESIEAIEASLAEDNKQLSDNIQTLVEVAEHQLETLSKIQTEQDRTLRRDIAYGIEQRNKFVSDFANERDFEIPKRPQFEFKGPKPGQDKFDAMNEAMADNAKRQRAFAAAEKEGLRSVLKHLDDRYVNLTEEQKAAIEKLVAVLEDEGKTGKKNTRQLRELINELSAINDNISSENKKTGFGRVFVAAFRPLTRALRNISNPITRALFGVLDTVREMKSEYTEATRNTVKKEQKASMIMERTKKQTLRAESFQKAEKRKEKSEKKKTDKAAAEAAYNNTTRIEKAILGNDKSSSGSGLMTGVLLGRMFPALLAGIGTALLATFKFLAIGSLIGSAVLAAARYTSDEIVDAVSNFSEKSLEWLQTSGVEYTEKLFEFTKAANKSVADSAADIVLTLGETLVKGVSKMFDKIYDAIASAITDAFQGVMQWTGTGVDKILEIFNTDKSAVEKIQEASSSAFEHFVKEPAQAAFAAVSSTVPTVLEYANDIAQVFSPAALANSLVEKADNRYGITDSFMDSASRFKFEPDIEALGYQAELERQRWEAEHGASEGSYTQIEKAIEIREKAAAEREKEREERIQMSPNYQGSRLGVNNTNISVNNTGGSRGPVFFDVPSSYSGWLQRGANITR